MGNNVKVSFIPSYLRWRNIFTSYNYTKFRVFSFTLEATNLITYGMKYLTHCSTLLYLSGVCMIYGINWLDFLAKNVNSAG
jgi:hypothetical protein